MLGAALLVVLGRDIIRSGLLLVLSFAGLAGIYALLGATLVAAAQVLVYIGAISVLILFAIMLTQSKSGPGTPRLPAPGVGRRRSRPSASSACCSCAILLTTWPLAARRRSCPGARHDVALLLFDDYVFAFEVISVLLLAAVIGGLYLARRDPDDAGRRDALGCRALAAPTRRRVSQSLEAYLVLAALLFGIGIFGFLSQAQRHRDAHVPSRSCSTPSTSPSSRSASSRPALAAQASTIALFVIAVAAAEATVGLAIVIAIYRNRRTPLVDEYASMRE